MQVKDIDARVFVCISEERGFQSEKVFTEDRGRPRYNISEEQLQYFIAFGFKAKEMAVMLAVSEANIRRRFQDIMHAV